MTPPDEKSGLHPRNRHRARYDFAALIRTEPALAPFVRPNEYGDESIDFADPHAVKALNRALLRHYYGVASWDIPAGYLCPPIPGRADYLHHAADLLATRPGGAVPRGPDVAVLDVGTGANCIYPILGAHEYGWRFVGSESDPAALASARRIVAANPTLIPLVTCRHQPRASAIFHGIIQTGECFDLTICNPPFHASRAEAAAGTQRKVRNLAGGKRVAPVLNFGGQTHELISPGGELVFVRRMIAESVDFATNCRWFTTLVSKSANLPMLRQALARTHPAEIRVIPMRQGQKQSRILAWTFRRSAKTPRTLRFLGRR